MYAKGKVTVRYFKVNKEATEKTFFGRVSETINDGEENGNTKFIYDKWFAMFVGKAYEKAKSLENNTKIVLTEWIARNPDSNTGEGTFPHIRVVDFELAPQNENQSNPQENE